MGEPSSQPHLRRRGARTAARSTPGRARTRRRAVDLRPERRLATGCESDLILVSNIESDGFEVVKRLKRDARTDDDALPRFLDEVRAATALTGVGFLPARRIRKGSGEMALVMPWMDGPDLLTFLVECVRRGRTPRLEAVLPLALQLGEALVTVHQGVAGLPPSSHGAVSPENVLLSMKGSCALIDFGATRPLSDAPAGERRDLKGLAEVLWMLRRGALPGTPPPPLPRQVSPEDRDKDEYERGLDRLISRLYHSMDDGGFPTAEAFLGALRAFSRPAMLRESGPTLVAELQLLFGPGEGGSSGIRPPLLPMVASWMPPVPRSAPLRQPPEPEGAAETKKARKPRRARPKAPPPEAKPWREVAANDVAVDTRERALRDTPPTRPQRVRPPTLPGRAVRGDPDRRKPRIGLGVALVWALITVGAFAFMFGAHQARQSTTARVVVGPAQNPPPVTDATTLSLTQEPANEVAPKVDPPAPELAVKEPPVAAAEQETEPRIAPEPEVPVVRSEREAAKAAERSEEPPARKAVAEKPAVVEEPEAVPEPPLALSASPRPTVQDDRVSLNILTTPPGATIHVDGEVVGTSPIRVPASPDSMAEITAQLDGYAASMKIVRAKADRDVIMELQAQ